MSRRQNLRSVRVLPLRNSTKTASKLSTPPTSHEGPEMSPTIPSSKPPLTRVSSFKLSFNQGKTPASSQDALTRKLSRHFPMTEREKPVLRISTDSPKEVCEPIGRPLTADEPNSSISPQTMSQPVAAAATSEEGSGKLWGLIRKMSHSVIRDRLQSPSSTEQPMPPGHRPSVVLPPLPSSAIPLPHRHLSGREAAKAARRPSSTRRQSSNNNTTPLCTPSEREGSNCLADPPSPARSSASSYGDVLITASIARKSLGLEGVDVEISKSATHESSRIKTVGSASTSGVDEHAEKPAVLVLQVSDDWHEHSPSASPLVPSFSTAGAVNQFGPEAVSAMARDWDRDPVSQDPLPPSKGHLSNSTPGPPLHTPVGSALPKELKDRFWAAFSPRKSVDITRIPSIISKDLVQIRRRTKSLDKGPAIPETTATSGELSIPSKAITEKERVDRWEELLLKSDRAGGTIHATVTPLSLRSLTPVSS